jgi:hypothetical protein
MGNHNWQRDPDLTGETRSPIVSVPRGEGTERQVIGQCLARLSRSLASLHHGAHQGANQVIIRFKNGFGAMIVNHPRLAGIYEMAPLRFHGPGPDDYEFYFASHIPDLTWCAATDDMVRVGQQISRLRPAD